ncbi:MAG: T9SS type A sorting domain-containing protein [Chlorobi bacterium]|nr:T9SS type A sorting domain-containing protein [Chlorobiota bacterium]MCI0715178.1 T9SS type A sorting domain-containing protein [Chlorobiota bacterium]
MKKIFKASGFSLTCSITSVILFVFLAFGFLNNSLADWEHVSNGLGNNPIVISLSAKDNILFAGTQDNGVFFTTNNGESWTQTSLNNRTVWDVFVSGNYILAGTAFNGVYVSKDNGVSWVQSTLNDITVWTFTQYGDNILAGTSFYGVHLSTDNGQTWNRISYNLVFVRALLVLGNDILAGAFDVFNRGIYRSTDNGVNWSQTSFNIANVSELEINGNILFAGVDDFNSNNNLNGVYTSADNGGTWTQTLSSVHIDDLSIIGNNIFAGAYQNGVYVSNDNGSSWVQRNEGLSVNPTVTTFTKLGNYIFAGTQNNGVYRRQIDELVGIKQVSSEIPNEFSLSQNYPNPFNPMTNVKFQMPKEGFVKLIVFDALGREIAALVNEELKPGTYEVRWDAANYPSGVYFYRITASDYSHTKKMILVK